MLIFATSDKGGTGRSVTSSNMLYRSALQGSDVCYLDFDFGSPTAGAIFNIAAMVHGTTPGRPALVPARRGRRAAAGRRVAASPTAPACAAGRRAPGRLVLLPGDSGGGEFPLTREHGRALRPAVPAAGGGVRPLPGRPAAPAGRTPPRWCSPRPRSRSCATSGPAGWSSTAGPGSTSSPRPGWCTASGASSTPASGTATTRPSWPSSLRFVRTAVVDPDSPELEGLRPAQVAWLRDCDRDLAELASGQQGRPDPPARHRSRSTRSCNGVSSSSPTTTCGRAGSPTVRPWRRSTRWPRRSSTMRPGRRCDNPGVAFEETRRSDAASSASRSRTSPSSSATSTWRSSPAARSRCAGTSAGSRPGPGRRAQTRRRDAGRQPGPGQHLLPGRRLLHPVQHAPTW